MHMRTVSSYSCAASLVALLAVLLVPQPGWAQTTSGQPQSSRWTFEVYGGGAAPTISTSGSPLTTFPIGPSFTTDAGRPSRLQSSWYFGDGARMLNDALAEFARLNGTSFARVVSLDAALTANALSKSGGATFGARLGRSLSPKLGIEIGVERSKTPLAFTNAFTNALEASSNSFQAAFQDLLNSAPASGVDVTSTLDVSGVSGRETRVTGALRYTLVQNGKTTAYATVGGGLAMADGDGPEATLVGSYAFRYFGAFPIRERDRTFIRVDQPGKTAMAMVGGGITYDVTPRVGVRVDVRMSLSGNKASLLVSGSPDITEQTTAAVLSSATTPGLQFSSRAGTLSSLGGANSKLTTFVGSGRNRHVSFTIGLFRRF
jgi:hypothetical protein